jgi:hypothetical protein
VLSIEPEARVEAKRRPPSKKLECWDSARCLHPSAKLTATTAEYASADSGVRSVVGRAAEREA